MTADTSHTTRSPLRLLLVEDSTDDAELLVYTLRHGGYDIRHERVQTADEMRRALETGEWDLVISDYSLPTFSGPEALQVLLERGLDLPFIIISGTIGEETAVTALKAGAHDFLVKGRLARLFPAIERELRDVAARRERARAEEALRQSESKHRALIERAVFGICQVTVGGRFLTVNPALVAMLGYDSPEELASIDLRSLNADAALTSLIEPVADGTQFSGREAVWRRKNGDPIRVRLSGRSLDGPHGEGPVLELIVEDTTERYRLEEQLRQAQKMEAIGHLAGGIAHDFNNLLTAILGYGALVMEQLEDRPDLAADVDEIVRAGQRGRALTAQLLAFSRKQVVTPVVLSLNETIAGVEKLLQHAIGKTIRLESQLDADLRPINADAGQVEQVLMNLAINARDAMPDAGLLRISTANVVAGRGVPPPLHPGRTSDAYVALTVSDTGCGMPPQVIERIFDPFFTTKPPGKGTGLGLSTVYGIMIQSGGHIVVDSEPDKGTTFTMYFPAVLDPVHASTPAPVTDNARNGSETILIVEDDPTVRGLALRVLERCGYVTLTASDGASGERAAAECQGRIDLLITDIRMPDITGPDLAQRLVCRWPALKVLYISGYAEDATRIVTDDPRLGFLQKPFSPEQLTSRVRECLDTAATGDKAKSGIACPPL
jgi:PAS domain S-box-containing protein